MRKIALIFAGGVGQRMGANIPKQFLKVYNKEIIIHTIEKFQYTKQIDKIYVGCKEEYISYLKELVKKYNITKIPEDGIIPGGVTGQDTIYNLLVKARKENDGDSVVLIHDGVRPLITDELIEENIKNVIKYGTSITCSPCTETPVVSNDGKVIDNILKRNTVYIAKAPQCFILDEIIAAHNKVRNTELGYNDKKIVDSCSLYMSTGKKIHLTEGNRENIKVTTVEDYISLLATLSVEDQKQIFILKEQERGKYEQNNWRRCNSDNKW